MSVAKKQTDGRKLLARVQKQVDARAGTRLREVRALGRRVTAQEKARAQELELRQVLDGLDTRDRELLTEHLWEKVRAMAQARERPLVRASNLLGFVELLVPRRIADEEIGDAMEQILQMVERGCPRWHIYLKVASTIFWVLLNAFRTSGRRAAARKPLKRKG